MKVRDMKNLLEQFDDNDFVVLCVSGSVRLPQKVEKALIVTTEVRGKRRFWINPPSIPIHSIGRGKVVLIS